MAEGEGGGDEVADALFLQIVGSVGGKGRRRKEEEEEENAPAPSSLGTFPRSSYPTPAPTRSTSPSPPFSAPPPSPRTPHATTIRETSHPFLARFEEEG